MLRYAERQHGDWSAIQQAEVDVSLVKPDYIIEGKVDLIRGEGDTVEIVDFKAERKPDMEKMRDRQAVSPTASYLCASRGGAYRAKGQQDAPLLYRRGRRRTDDHISVYEVCRGRNAGVVR